MINFTRCLILELLLDIFVFNRLLKEKVKEMEEKELRHAGEGWYLERSRLKDIIDEKNQQLEKMKRDQDLHRDHIDNIRREVSTKAFKRKCVILCFRLF